MPAGHDGTKYSCILVEALSVDAEGISKGYDQHNSKRQKDGANSSRAKSAPN